MFRILTIFSFIVAINCDCPKIVSRSDWKADPPKDSKKFTETPLHFVVISESVTLPCNNETICQHRVKAIQDNHMKILKWDDIGFNFLIGGDGNVYEGRGWDVIGAHTKKYNNRSIGICFIGSFDDNSPPENQLQAAKDLISCGLEEGKLGTDYHLFGYKSCEKDCSDKSLFKIIQSWTNYAPKPK